jgi:hypothetical protein
MSPFDHPLVSERYFFPRSGSPPDRLDVPVAGAVLACSHRLLDPSWPTMIHFHGNGEIVADYVPELDVRIGAGAPSCQALGNGPRTLRLPRSTSKMGFELPVLRGDSRAYYWNPAAQV